MPGWVQLAVTPVSCLAFARAVNESLAGAGVSHARLRLLGALACDGPQIMAALSAALGITPRAVTKLVDALEAEGLVRRAAHPTDRRATVIEATDKGCALGEPLPAKQIAAVGRIFAPLTPPQRRELLAIVRMLNGAGGA